MEVQCPPNTIRIRTLIGLLIEYPCDTLHSTYISMIKKFIYEKDNIPIHLMKILYNGKNTDDNDIINPCSLLHLIVNLRGGMFH